MRPPWLSMLGFCGKRIEETQNPIIAADARIWLRINYLLKVELTSVSTHGSIEIGTGLRRPNHRIA
jgi:hypothetical protein